MATKKTFENAITELEKVVSEGSGKKAYIEGYRVAGKTGVFTQSCTNFAGQKWQKNIGSLIICKRQK